MRKGEVAWIRVGPAYHKNIYHTHCDKKHLERQGQADGEDIFMKLCVESIKRDPLLKDKGSYKGLKEYFEVVREVAKECVVEEDFNNAMALYKKCLGSIRNMQKKLKDSLSEEEQAERNEIMVLLNLNLSLVYLKLKKPLESVKSALEATQLNPSNCKAHYRLYIAYFQSNDLEKAKPSLAEAIKLEPNNKTMRQQYKELLDLMGKKEREWYSKMSGFYDSDKLKKIEQKDEETEKLRQKVHRQTFGDEEEYNEEEEMRQRLEAQKKPHIDEIRKIRSFKYGRE
eukprot:CAMPEP_0168616674 /NCGR_PEP_ID=MMETSP0449_2-20121227/5146_1 /TAXON_ID=1082188 /ORGANISM="Strombidium rassoulzadegani, Strain ras09" /LENGTH=283 /DNA_ID=CAMNT_0008657461 /DNA_START=33 /DNA_END=882 /DNA_ORIENTATION=-